MLVAASGSVTVFLCFDGATDPNDPRHRGVMAVAPDE